MGNTFTQITAWSVNKFIDECCEGCAPGARNEICFKVETMDFYRRYETYCYLEGLPRAEFPVVMEHVRKYFKIQNGKIRGIMIAHDPLTGRRQTHEKSYRRPTPFFASDTGRAGRGN